MTASARFRVAAVRLDPCSEAEVVERVAAWSRARSGHPRTVCFVNAWSIAAASRDEEFRQAINDSDLSVVDGVPVAWLGRRLVQGPCERLCGVDLMHELLSAPKFSDLSHFVCGGSQEALDRLEFRYSLGGTIRTRRIVGTWSPPYRDLTAAEESALAARVASLRPDILWVCLGTVRQEKWMARMRHRLSVPVLAGVGAAVDFLSGSKPRAPRWMQRAGLEWLFRLVTEPRRLKRRYLVGNLVFLRLALAELWRRAARQEQA